MSSGFGGDDDFQDDEDENVAVAKIEFWRITAHIHGKEISISIGDGTQRVKWLAHVAIGMKAQWTSPF